MHENLESIVFIVEVAAAFLLLSGLVISTGRYFYKLFQGEWRQAYTEYRRDLGRTLLLALEFLIAADILETVAVEKTLSSLALLAGLVVVRTFLSFALEVELTGRWPWQSKNETPAKD